MAISRHVVTWPRRRSRLTGYGVNELAALRDAALAAPGALPVRALADDILRQLETHLAAGQSALSGRPAKSLASGPTHPRGAPPVPEVRLTPALRAGYPGSKRPLGVTCPCCVLSVIIAPSAAA